jgi:hypothetical protein
VSDDPNYLLSSNRNLRFESVRHRTLLSIAHSVAAQAEGAFSHWSCPCPGCEQVRRKLKELRMATMHISDTLNKRR